MSTQRFWKRSTANLGAKVDRFRNRAHHATFDDFESFTMIARKQYVQNLLLATQFASVRGSVVECGVWRGGMIAGIARLLGPDRHYVFV